MPRAKSSSGKPASHRGYSAPALEKGMDIIELLADAESGLSVSEISQRLKRRMSELFRIVVVMEQRGWLQKDAETSRYSVTYHVLKLAHRGTPTQTLTSAAGPAMQELSTRINQSCHLVVRSGTQGLVILRQENQRRHANLSVRLGAVIELVSSCSGQILLSHLDPAGRQRLLQTIPRPAGMSKSRLEAILEKIRKRGFEIQRSPITAGVTDIGYPIRGFDGQVLAALTVPYLHALDDSLPTDLEKTRRLLEQAAGVISRNLGWGR
ncbi:MAG TPA: IclR family transcriptional regulator [Steroidobacteraceae bacterium]|jgi:DNA-binding IclR family transcriptional regulator|nr:IclR family transcriptional regulator [Steroidobacteraceae bacterium]